MVLRRMYIAFLSGQTLSDTSLSQPSESTNQKLRAFSKKENRIINISEKCEK